jgi:ribosome-binding ATPase
LGNKFLSHIREVDLILFVIRGFTDENIIREGSTDPKSDFETLKTELCLKDLETLEKLLNEKHKGTDKPGGLSLRQNRDEILNKIKLGLNNNILISNLDLDREEREFIKQYCFLTDKPYLILLNVDENRITNYELRIKNEGESRDTFLVSAKLENELSEMSDDEQKEYLESISLKEAPLKGVIRAAFDKLNLIQFFTTGTDETRSWTIINGSTAPQAAGVIHTDFEKGFIKAEIVSYEDFVNYGLQAKCREVGKLRQEGREYVVKDGDIAEFRFN